MVYHLRPDVYQFGWSRGDLFLVLSGYLITAVILKHGGGPGFHRTFFARRALRTWPAYYLTLFALVAVNPLLPKPFPLDGLPYYLTFTQNTPYYWTTSVPRFQWYFHHTWTLALEEQFYLVWPSLALLAGRRRLVPLAAGLAVVSVVARSSGLHAWTLLGRCDGFALGGLLAALTTDGAWMARHRAALRRGLGVVGVLTFAVLAAESVAFGGGALTGPAIVYPGPTVLAMNLFYASVVGLTVCHAGRPALRPLRSGALLGLGRVSYGLYLYHPLVFITVAMAGRGLGLDDPWWLEPLKIAACVALASLSWRHFERPILRLKNGLRYQPAPAGAAPRTWDVTIPPAGFELARLARRG
jgi:peptidoglycan/LPS O-acetylase OafA/YrhL